MGPRSTANCGLRGWLPSHIVYLVGKKHVPGPLCLLCLLYIHSIYIYILHIVVIVHIVYIVVHVYTADMVDDVCLGACAPADHAAELSYWPVTRVHAGMVVCWCGSVGKVTVAWVAR